MKIIAAAALATTALFAQPVHAGSTCGGGGGGGGSSSSSSSDGDSSWSSSSSSSDHGSDASPTPACIDDTDVVGYRQCTKFGNGWGMNPRVPRMFVELGTNVRQFSAAASAREGTVSHGSESFMYRTVTPEGGGDASAAAAVASNLRIGVGLGHGLYAGIEGELGALTNTPARVEMMSSGVFGAPEIEARTALLFGGAGFVGARVSHGRASLSIEGAGGARNVRYRYASSYRYCDEVSIVDVVTPVLEARARAELWLNPWFTVGAQAGSNVAAKGDWMTGFYLGIHSRAFGGR